MLLSKTSRRKALSKKALRKKAGPDTMGPGVSPMGGGGGAGGSGGSNASPGLGGAPGPEGLGHWKCQFPDCKRQFGNGQDFRDHLHTDHSVKDVG